LAAPLARLVIGHMGEMPARIDEVSELDIKHLKRPIGRAILDQVWLTTSGVFSEPPFLAAVLTFGIDRVMATASSLSVSAYFCPTFQTKVIPK